MRIDSLIKRDQAARHDVVDLESHEPSLEDIFLTFYGAHTERGEPDGA